MAEITTERLIMRGWREADLAPWAAMNADPEVRRYVGPLLRFEQAAAWALNYQDDRDRYDFGFWAVEIRTSLNTDQERDRGLRRCGGCFLRAS